MGIFLSTPPHMFSYNYERMSAADNPIEGSDTLCSLLTIGHGVKLVLLWDSNATCRRLQAMQNPFCTRPMQIDERTELRIDRRFTNIRFSCAPLRHGEVVVYGGDIVERC